MLFFFYNIMKPTLYTLGLLAITAVTYLISESAEGSDLSPDSPVFAPATKNAIHTDRDKPAGTWNWADAAKMEMPNGFPTAQNKWKSGKDDTQRASLQSLCKSWHKADPSSLSACPAAADYPGLPGEKDVKLVTRTITVDPSFAGWHSTGLYAPPGGKVTVTFPENVTLRQEEGKRNKNIYDVRIGCHKDKLGERHKQWSRLPDITVSKPVTGTTTEITNPMGGLIYVCVNGNQHETQPFDVTISPAVPSPIFILGKTSTDDWKQQLATTTAPWGEIQTPRLTVTLAINQLKQCPDIQSIAACLQKNMALEDWLIAWDKFPNKLKSPMRIVVDRQISAGSGHSGYPAMGLFGWGKPIATGSLLTHGSWGFWHELGHNHQTPPFRLDGLGEVTVNLFSLICQVQGIGLDFSNAWGGLKSKSLAQKLNAYFTGTETYHENRDHSLRLAFFADLMKGIGFKPFRAAAIAYHANPYDAKKTSNDAKWDWLMVELSKGAGKNLAKYFETWRIPVSPEAKAEVKNLPTWMPSQDYPACYISAQ